MPLYSSNEELFQHVRDLAIFLKSQGHTAAAASLQDGLASLNGLTDGWALLLESTTNVIHLCGSEMDSAILAQLENIQAAVRKMVYR